MNECSVSGCIRQSYSGGLCGSHYRLDLAARAPRCTQEGCVATVHAKGLCDRHYRELVRSQNGPCKIDGCHRPMVAKGLCDAHRQRLWKRGDLNTSRPADWGAKSAHPLYEIWQWKKRQYTRDRMDSAWFDDFWAFVVSAGERPSKRHKMRVLREGEPLGPDNFAWVAPSIEVEKQESKTAYQRVWMRRYRENNPEKFASYEFKKRYGLDYAAYQKMEEDQNGLCAICAKPETAEHHITGKVRSLAVDHCHDGGHIRGLLCSACNTAIGLLKDDPAILRAAIAYLEKHLPPPA